MAEAQASDVDPIDNETISAAGDAMMMLITRSTWETLLRQGAAEGIGPGQVIDKALRFYLEEHGSAEVVEYLNLVSGGRR
jgi:hypothetical protein